MQIPELLPHLFRTEYSKLTAVLAKHFGLEHIQMAEDIASDTFLAATETWSFNGLPPNPTAWLYAVAKNKAKDYLQRNQLFSAKIKPQLENSSPGYTAPDLDLSTQNITDSQLQMLFAVCHPAINPEAQIGLALRILCGFGIDEIASAFLTSKETINKRLFRAKEKLRTENVKIEFPPETQIQQRLETVLTTLYLFFNEGYFSRSQNATLRKDLCLEAMRLTHLLTENPQTNIPNVKALLSLMCFQASRFEARIDQAGETVLYQKQDTALWNTELIARGEYYLIQATTGNNLSKYHLEGALAYWHTKPIDTSEKWEAILQLYNLLLQQEYSPMAALNRTYALAKVHGNAQAIKEAEKLSLAGNHLYHSLLGELYLETNTSNAILHFRKALSLSKSDADKTILTGKIALCERV